MRRHLPILFAAILALSACAPLPKALLAELSQTQPAAVSFDELLFYMRRAAAAYTTAPEIRASFPQVTRVAELSDVDVLYFIEATPTHQTLTVRGTANRENRLQDLEIALVPDRLLGIPLHSGFQEDAAAILADAAPHLDMGRPVRLTGHSLGGAAVAVLANYLDKIGYEVTRVVTFGQPRFTSKRPSKAVLAVSTRVVNQHDLIPLVPPDLPALPYRHFGAEVMLRAGPAFAVIEAAEAPRVSQGNFLRSLEGASIAAHHRQKYFANIKGKAVSGAQQVPYLAE